MILSHTSRRKRIVPSNARLATIEEKYIVLPARIESKHILCFSIFSEDSSSIPSTSKANMDPSASLFIPIYNSPPEQMFQRVKTLRYLPAVIWFNKSANGAKILFVPPNAKQDGFLFGIKSNDNLYPVSTGDSLNGY